ncbi:MAG: hypothetical protein JNM72_01945 [Deltaproteobacteria bacterium]|nr:hypothetical protein [Deltaproteobacteria bacterium]
MRAGRIGALFGAVLAGLGCAGGDEKLDSGAGAEVCGPPSGAAALTDWIPYTDTALGVQVRVTGLVVQGQSLVYTTGAAVYTVAIDGGAPAELQGAGDGAATTLELLRDDSSVLVREGLNWWRYPDDGGAARTLEVPFGYATLFAFDPAADQLWGTEADYNAGTVTVVVAELGGVETGVALPAQARGEAAPWLRAPDGSLVTQGGGAADFDPALFRFVDGAEQALTADPPVGALLGVTDVGVIYVGEAQQGARRGLYALPLDGGPADEIGPQVGAAGSGWQTPEGLLLSDGAAVWRVGASGGVKRLADLPGEACAVSALGAGAGVVYGATQRLDTEETLLWAIGG